MKRIVPWLLLTAGCANFGEAPAQPLRLPLAHGVTEIVVEPVDPAAPKMVVKDKQRIIAAIRALEGSPEAKWRRPAAGSFPAARYRLTIKDWNRERDLLLGDDWFGGPSGETHVLRRLTHQEQEEISGLLGVELKISP